MCGVAVGHDEPQRLEAATNGKRKVTFGGKAGQSSRLLAIKGPVALAKNSETADLSIARLEMKAGSSATSISAAAPVDRQAALESSKEAAGNAQMLAARLHSAESEKQDALNVATRQLMSKTVTPCAIGQHSALGQHAHRQWLPLPVRCPYLCT